MRVIGERLGVPRTLTFGASPSCSVAIGDFDGNGEADIAVGATDARDVSVLLGDAFNPFASIAVTPRSDWPIVDAEAEVDGITYRAKSSALFSTTTVSHGASTGEPARSMNGALAVVADFDGDGTAELVPAMAGATALASGDFDGDGLTDVVAADGRATSVNVLFGGRRDGFMRRRVIEAGIAATRYGLAVGDLDRDGFADLVLLGDDCATVVVLRGDGGGSLLPYLRTTVDPLVRSNSGDAVTDRSEPDAYRGIASLTLNPATIAGGSGATSTGTITLNAPAPSGGVAVMLTSSNLELAASVPSITVAAGASTATFTIGTNKNYRRYSGLAFNVTISATHGTTTRSATLALTAQPRPGTLSSFDAHNQGNMCFGVGVRRTTSGYVLEFGSAGNLFNCVPPANPVGQDGTCTFQQECSLGCEFRPPQNGFKFSDVCATTGPFPVAVNPKLVIGGNQSLALLRLNAAAPANSSGILSSATVLANTIPNISTPIAAGATSADAAVLTSRVSSPQFAPIDGSYSTPRADGSRGGRGGLTWLALAPGTPPPFELTSLTLDQASVAGGTFVFAFAQMNQVAPAPEIATATMTVSSSNPSAASIPQPSVTFTHGSSSAGVGIETHAVSADAVVTISAKVGGQTLTSELTVRTTPGATSVTSFFLDPLTVTGGDNSIGTVVLNGAAPSGGAIVALQSSNTAVAAMPATVTVPAGSDRTSFIVTTSAVSSSTTVTLNANYNSTWAATSLTVSPASSPPPVQTAALTVTATGRSGERVTSNPAGINVTVGSTGSASFPTGTSITLSVSNGRDAIWSGACSSGGNKAKTCTFTLNAAASVTANVQ
jgi:hypothetical protein